MRSVQEQISERCLALLMCFTNFCSLSTQGSGCWDDLDRCASRLIALVIEFWVPLTTRYKIDQVRPTYTR